MNTQMFLKGVNKSKYLLPTTVNLHQAECVSVKKSISVTESVRNNLLSFDGKHLNSQIVTSFSLETSES